MKFFYFIVSIVLGMSILTGCGMGSTEPVLTEKKVLKFCVRGISKDSVTGALVEEYNKIQDDVTVEYEVYGENYRNVMAIALLSDSPPDIIELNGGLTVDELVKGQHIIPIDVYVTDELKRQFYSDIFEQNEIFYDGQLYTIPQRLANFKLFYNKTIFAKAGLNPDDPPESIEEMLTYAKTISEVGHGNYYGYGLPLKTNSTYDRFLDNVGVLSGIGGPSGFNWEKGQYEYVSYEPLFEVLLQMVDEGSIYPNPFSLDLEVSRALFAEGKFAMMIDGCWMPAIYNNEEVINTQDWDVTDIPVFEGVDRQKGYMTYDMGKVITSHSDYPDEAWDFVDFLLENQEAYVGKGEPLRTKISTNNKDIFPDNHIGYEAFADVENYRSYAYDMGTYVKGLSIDKYDIYKSIMLKETAINEALSQLDVLYNEALKDKPIIE